MTAEIHDPNDGPAVEGSGEDAPIDIAQQQVDEGLVHQPDQDATEEDDDDLDDDFEDEDDEFEEGLLGEADED